MIGVVSTTGVLTTLLGRERLAQWIERSKLSQLETAERIGMDPTQLSHKNAIKIEQATGIVVEDWVPLADDDEDEAPSTTARKSRIAKS